MAAAVNLQLGDCYCTMLSCIYAGTVFGSVSSRPEGWSSDTPRTTDISREGPFDAYASPVDTEVSHLVTTGLPGCPYAFGMQLHHPRFLEFIGAPESARLLYHSPKFWVDRLGEEDAMAAAVNLQRDAGIMLSNLQILSQFVMSLHRMSSEIMTLWMGRVVFPSEEVADLSTAPRSPGQRSTWLRWVCGAYRLVRVIPGQCRPRPATHA